MIKSKLNKECGIRLKECLSDSKMTQNELSLQTGYTQQYISNIIVGKKPMTIAAAKLFAEELGVREEYLLCKDNLKTWLDEDRALKEESSQACDYIINYLQSLGISIIPLIAFPKDYESTGKFDNEDEFIYFKDSKHKARIVDKNGNIHQLMKAPWFLGDLFKDERLSSEQATFFGHIIFIAIETPTQNIILSLDEFPLFLKNIDDFVKFGINNFLDNYESIKEFYTPDF